jgi:phospholipase D1/2
VAWAPFAFVAAYVVGGLVIFPVTVLSAVTAIIFPPLKAVVVSFSGIMLSAALLHWLGMRFIKGRLRKSLASVIERVDQALTDRGIITIATIRMIPLAPFTLVNIAAGAVGVRFRDYMLGTALGLAPGVTVICIFGRQVRVFWHDPNLKSVLLVVAIGVAWIAMSLVLQRWISQRRRHATA